MKTRQQQVIAELRSRILHGAIASHEKLSESHLAEALNVSRTPIRHALAVLVEEGLLVRLGPRGYSVRTYQVGDLVEAIDLRALIEGYAARRLAVRGIDAALLADLDRCLGRGDQILGTDQFGLTEEADYAAMNTQFHDLIVAAEGGALTEQLRGLIDRVPFGAPNALAFDRMGPEQRHEILRYAHRQHHAIVDAICERDGARAEALFREHTAPVKQSLGLGRHAGIFPIHTLPFIDPEAAAPALPGIDAPKRRRRTRSI